VGAAGPRLPAYGEGCLSDVVPALLAEGRPAAWLPDAVRDARQIVLLVLDGVGWNQLRERPSVAPALSSMEGGAITSVAPTTTATALTSIVQGRPPCAHGVVGYRLRVGAGDVLNVLRWRTADGDARETVPPATFQPDAAFGGLDVPIVTRSEFAGSGFTTAQGLGPLVGWRRPSAIAVEVSAALAAGRPLVYAYYDGVDAVAHERGFGPHYDAELAGADALVATLSSALPAGAALLVTSDHGQVEVGDRTVALDPELLAMTSLVSGEGRFLWLHAAAPDRADDLEAAARRRFEATGMAWVRTRRQVVTDGWFGGPLAREVEARLGDVALVARQPVAFLDPADPGSAGLRCRHGSLTDDELLVPLLATARAGGGRP
jgi:hypothetical protein